MIHMPGKYLNLWNSNILSCILPFSKYTLSANFMASIAPRVGLHVRIAYGLYAFEIFTVSWWRKKNNIYHLILHLLPINNCPWCFIWFCSFNTINTWVRYSPWSDIIRNLGVARLSNLTKSWFHYSEFKPSSHGLWWPCSLHCTMGHSEVSKTFNLPSKIM